MQSLPQIAEINKKIFTPIITVTTIKENYNFFFGKSILFWRLLSIEFQFWRIPIFRDHKKIGASFQIFKSNFLIIQFGDVIPFLGVPINHTQL